MDRFKGADEQFTSRQKQKFDLINLNEKPVFAPSPPKINKFGSPVPPPIVESSLTAHDRKIIADNS